MPVDRLANQSAAVNRPTSKNQRPTHQHKRTRKYCIRSMGLKGNRPSCLPSLLVFGLWATMVSVPSLLFRYLVALFSFKNKCELRRTNLRGMLLLCGHPSRLSSWLNSGRLFTISFRCKMRAHFFSLQNANVLTGVRLLPPAWSRTPNFVVGANFVINCFNVQFYAVKFRSLTK